MIKMADCIIKKNGANADTSDLTALPSSVKEGKIFLGRGSDEEQIGTMPIIQPEKHELQLNQSKLAIGTPSTNQQIRTDRPPLNCRD